MLFEQMISLVRDQEMRLSGFTAGQSFTRQQGSYLQRTSGQTVARVVDVRPQLIRQYLCHGAFGCCLDGNQGCCGFWLYFCPLPGEE
jgi:hypothetical protein